MTGELNKKGFQILEKGNGCASAVKEFNELRELNPDWNPDFYEVGELFAEMRLGAINLSNANLKMADLSYSNLQGTNLRGANLSNANLNEAKLEFADLTGADLTNASLRGATVNCTNFVNTCVTLEMLGCEFTNV